MTPTASRLTFQSALVGRDVIADGTLALRFARPAGWSYRAGQFVDITLLRPLPGADGETGGFSISSAPFENVIEIVVRIGPGDTPLKRALREAPLGSVVRMDGPFGSLQLHDADRPAVFLAGGTGIAPFRSMLVEAIQRGSLPYRIVLIHANRRPRDAAFADEFLALERAEPNLTFVPTMTAMASSPEEWDGERGHIDAAMLGRHLAGVHGPIYYIAGPPGMVQALRTTIVAAGVARDDVRSESEPTRVRSSPDLAAG